MVSDQELNRMRWAARRGMLELDLILEPFVNSQYTLLDDVGRRRFGELMLSEDQDLFTWFLGRKKPDDEELAVIVEQILQFARTAPEHR